MLLLTNRLSLIINLIVLYSRDQIKSISAQLYSSGAYFSPCFYKYSFPWTRSRNVHGVVHWHNKYVQNLFSKSHLLQRVLFSIPRVYGCFLEDVSSVKKSAIALACSLKSFIFLQYVTVSEPLWRYQDYLDSWTTRKLRI